MTSAHIPAQTTPESVDSLINAGRIHFQSGRYAEAETTFERALTQQESIDPSDSICLDLLLDLAHLADLRGRTARQGLQLRRAAAFLLAKLGDTVRSEALRQAQYSLLSGNKQPQGLSDRS